jgi:hypothetical protein
MSTHVEMPTLIARASVQAIPTTTHPAHAAAEQKRFVTLAAKAPSETSAPKLSSMSDAASAIAKRSTPSNASLLVVLALSFLAVALSITSVVSNGWAELATPTTQVGLHEQCTHHMTTVADAVDANGETSSGLAANIEPDYTEAFTGRRFLMVKAPTRYSICHTHGIKVRFISRLLRSICYTVTYRYTTVPQYHSHPITFFKPLLVALCPAHFKSDRLCEH